MRRRASFMGSLSVVLAGLSGLSGAWLGSGCNFDNPGDPPPEALIYLPSNVLLSQAEGDTPARFLYVVNSNFDLRYNAGSLQAYDLDKLDEELARCERGNRLGAGCQIEPSRVISDEVLVPSFATGLTASTNHDRLFLVSRTENSMSVVDTREDSSDVLDCRDEDRRCNDDFVRGDDPDQSKRRLVMPPEPVGLVTGRAEDLVRPGDAALEGEFALVVHRGGQASLFLEESGRMTLTHVLEGLQLEPTGITFDPETKLAYVSVYDRTGTGLQTRVLLRVGVAVGGDQYPAYLYNAGAVSIEGVLNTADTRAITMNPAVAGEAIVVGHDPASLLWVDVTSALAGDGPPTQAFARASLSVGAGPSRVTIGTLGERTVAVVSCFDARQIYIVDAETAEPLSIVHNFSGPFEIALDSARQRLYVADFRSSVVRVLDLRPILEGATEEQPTARIVATLGRPKLVQELQ